MELSKCRICGERHRLGGCPESVARAVALGEAKRREKSSGGGASALGAIGTRGGEQLPCPVEAREKGKNLSPSGVTATLAVPSETNSGAPQPRGESVQTNATQPTGSPNKRAPRGTFDRKTYQRELMRKRRAEGKGGYERKTTNPKYKGRPRED